MGVIASTRQSVGLSGYVHVSDFPAQVEGIKVSNLSRFSALIFYPDGVPPSYAERYFGSNRQHHLIAPGGWLTLPVTRERFAIGADGILLGDDSLAIDAEMSTGVDCLIEEYDEPQPYISYRPEQLTIAQWEQKSVTPDAGAIALSALDSNYRLPQMRGGVLGLKIGNAGTEAGVDGYQYLSVQSRLGITGVTDYNYQVIPTGGKKCGGALALANYFHQQSYFGISNLENLVLYTTETGQRSLSGELCWINKPIDKNTRDPLMIDTYLAATASREFNRLSTRHLKQVVVPWSQAGAGAGSVVAKHYSANGNLTKTDTITATGATNGSTTLYPLADFIDFTITAGANGVLRCNLYADREYRI